MESPQELFRQTLAATGDRIAAIRVIRERFGLDPAHAKEVMLHAEGTAASLNEHEEMVAVVLKQALAEQRRRAEHIYVLGSQESAPRNLKEG